ELVQVHRIGQLRARRDVSDLAFAAFAADGDGIFAIGFRTRTQCHAVGVGCVAVHAEGDGIVPGGVGVVADRGAVFAGRPGAVGARRTAGAGSVGVDQAEEGGTTDSGALGAGRFAVLAHCGAPGAAGGGRRAHGGGVVAGG